MAAGPSSMAIMSGAGSGQTVPGAASMQLNPLGSSSMGQTNISPITATLPGAGSPQPMHQMQPMQLGNVPISGPTTAATNVPNTSGGLTVAGGFNPAAGVTNMSATTKEAGDFTAAGDLQAIYGRGTGSAIANVLGGLGTTTSIAEQNMIGSTMAAAQRGYGNIEAGMGARGVSADSSTAGLAAGDYWGQVAQGIAGETGQIGLQEEQTLLSALTGAGQAHGGDVSGWQQFGNVMQGIGQAGLQLGTAALSGSGGAGLLAKIGL